MCHIRNTPEVQHANADIGRSITDRATARLYLEKSCVDRLLTGFGPFIVILKREANPFDQEPASIGHVGLKLRKTAGAPTVPDIGFSLLKEFWGKGYATEACNGLLDHFEKEKGVKEVLGYCHPENENSKKMFRRLGFEDRGVRTLNGLRDDGGVVNALVWAKQGLSEDLSVYGI
jgi:RimJ/RimL family protein N-acetyltransferase